MKFKLGELGVIIENLIFVITDRNRTENTPKRRMPADAGYWLDKFLGTLQEEDAKFQKQRIELCETYAEKDANDKSIMIMRQLCQVCGKDYPENDKIKDENDQKVPRIVCDCGKPLVPQQRYDIKDTKLFAEALAKLAVAEIEWPWKQIPLEMLRESHVRCPKCNAIHEGPLLCFDGEEMAILKYFIEEPAGMKFEKIEMEKIETKEAD